MAAVVVAVAAVLDDVEEAEDGLEGSGEVRVDGLVERGERGDGIAREDGDFSVTTPGLGDSMLPVLCDGELREDTGGLGEAGICVAGG